MSSQLHREIQILKMNPWQKFILETLAGFETPTTNETKSPDEGLQLTLPTEKAASRESNDKTGQCLTFRSDSRV